MDIRVLFIITKGDLGGAQVHLLDLINGLRHRCQLCVGVGEEGFLTESLRSVGVQCEVIPSLVHAIHPLKDLRAISAVSSLIRTWKPHILHAHTSKAGVIGRVAAFLTGVPSVFTAHTWCFAERTSWKWKLLGTPSERLVGRVTDAIINVSESNRQLASRVGVSCRREMVTIRNGIPDVPFRADVRRAGIPVVLMTARFAAQKNQADLLRAAAASTADFRVWFAGDGPTRPAVEDLAQQLGVSHRVEFLGERRDIPELMAKAHIFALSSNWEGFPLTILEAMRAGLPVVASDVGGVREAVEDGATGFVVPAGDCHALADRLSCLAADTTLRQRLGSQARAAYERKFTVEAMARATFDVYKTVLGVPLAATPRREAPA